MKSIKEMADNLIFQLSTRRLKDRPLIVGIDGLSGAGKTTFVKKLRQELMSQNDDVIILHLDDYIVEKTKRYQTEYEEWYEYYFLQWDIKRLETELFKKINAKSKTLTLPFYDKSADTISTQQIKVSLNTICIIEGIFLQRKEWRDYFDYVIFIDCPRELRVERVLKRDLYIGSHQERLNKYQKRYWLGEEYYLNIENPMSKADIVYNSS